MNVKISTVKNPSRVRWGTSLVQGGAFLLITPEPPPFAFGDLPARNQPSEPDLFQEIRRIHREARQARGRRIQALFRRTQTALIRWVQGKDSLETGSAERTLKKWFWLAAGGTATSAVVLTRALWFHN